MGFWNKAGRALGSTAKFAYHAATVVGNEVEGKANEIRKTKEEYQSKTDQELREIANSSGLFSKSSTEKSVAAQILRTRNQNINSEQA